MSNSATILFDELEFRSSKVMFKLPYNGNPKHNLHNLNFLIENYCYFILKSLYSDEIYKISSRNVKGSFHNKESSFNGHYGHLQQGKYNYRISTAIDINKKIIQIPENEEEFFNSENRLLFFKNNLFVIIDSSKCLKYVDPYYNDVGNLTIDLARIIEQQDYISFGFVDNNSIITPDGSYEKYSGLVPDNFLKTALKGCTVFTRPKYYAIIKNKSSFEGVSYASIESLMSDLNINKSFSWVCRVIKQNSNVYDILKDKELLSSDLKQFKFIGKYLIIKSDEDGFLNEAYSHFTEIQKDFDAIDRINYLNNNKVCKVSQALNLFDCKSKEERSFYKAQLSSLKESLGNNFTINSIKERSQLGGIKKFNYVKGNNYHYYSWVENGNNYRV